MASQHMSCQLVDQLLEVLDKEVESMPEQTIESMQQQLYQAISALRNTLNIRRALLSLPAEILAQIVEEIPTISPTQASESWLLPSYWSPHLRDSCLLIPVSRTCRRLRDICLSRTLYWRHIASTHDAAISSVLIRSGDSPLSVMVDGNTYRTETKLHAMYASVAPRIRELYYLNVDYGLMKNFESGFGLVHSTLESLSCCSVDPRGAHWQRYHLVLDHDYFPRLKRIVLDGVSFRIESPLLSLTHLLLSRITLDGLHVKLAKLLQHTPNLNSLVLSGLQDHGVFETTDMPEVNLPNLRRIILHNLLRPSLRYCLSLTSRCAEEAATQVINDTLAYGQIAFKPVIKERIRARSATAVGIDISFASDSPGLTPIGHTFTVTIASPVSALRVMTTTKVLDSTYEPNVAPWVDHILAGRASFENVQVVWLSVTHIYPGPSHSEIFRDILFEFPALETIVLSVTYEYLAGGGGGVFPPLLKRCLPTISGYHVTPTLKTLRIVLCELGSLPSEGQAKTEESPSMIVIFTWMLKELASGAYCYFETLVLQITPNVVVRDADISQLREYFRTVLLETIREPPRMPLPQCCVEFDDGPGGSRTWTENLC